MKDLTFNTLRRAIETENVLSDDNLPAYKALVSQHLGHSEKTAETYYRIRDSRNCVQASYKLLHIQELLAFGGSQNVGADNTPLGGSSVGQPQVPGNPTHGGDPKVDGVPILSVVTRASIGSPINSNNRSQQVRANDTSIRDMPYVLQFFLLSLCMP